MIPEGTSFPWLRVLAFLGPRDVAAASLANSEIFEVAKHLTRNRQTDVARACEAFPVPAINDLDGEPYPYFAYTSHCVRGETTSRIEVRPWGHESASRPCLNQSLAKSFEDNFSSSFLGQGCCASLSKGKTNRDLSTSQPCDIVSCSCGVLIDGTRAYDEDGKLIRLAGMACRTMYDEAGNSISYSSENDFFGSIKGQPAGSAMISKQETNVSLSAHILQTKVKEYLMGYVDDTDVVLPESNHTSVDGVDSQPQLATGRNDIENEPICGDTCRTHHETGKGRVKRKQYMNTEFHKEEPVVVVECGPCCTCTRSCPNRVSQRGLSIHATTIKHPGKGWGLHAGQYVAAGSFICEYAGELLTNVETRERQLVYDGKGKSEGKPILGAYLMVVREHLPSGKAFLRVNIDPTNIGNVGRLMNHSCDGGNISLCLLRSMGNPLPRVGMFARKDIVCGEEMTFSYGGLSDELLPQARKCCCGAANCRGMLPQELT